MKRIVFPICYSDHLTKPGLPIALQYNSRDILLGSNCGTTGSGSQHLATVSVIGPGCWTISLRALTASSLLMFSNDILVHLVRV